MIDQIVYFGLTFFEVGLGYYILCCSIVNWNELRKRDRIILICTMLLLSILLATNRRIVFEYYNTLFVCNILTVLSVWFIHKKQLKLIIGVVATYYIFITLIEMVLAFLFMSILGNEYNQAMYWYSSSIWKFAVYLVILAIVMPCIEMTTQHSPKKEFDFSPFENMLLFMDLLLYCVYFFSQRMMGNMIYSEESTDGITVGTFLMIFLVITVFCVVAFIVSA